MLPQVCINYSFKKVLHTVKPVKLFMSSTIEQQPIFRTVGKRQARDGLAPTLGIIDAQKQMSNYITRVPKGLFFYNSHHEMEQDRLKWVVDNIQSKSFTQRA